MQRTDRAEIARQTLDILDRGSYTAPSGRHISIAREMAAALAGTRLYTPEILDDLVDAVQASPPRPQPGQIELAQETTLQAASRLLADPEAGSVMILNFASAKNAGGGFLGGSQAQEESLARSSGLYPCLMTQPRFYDFHRHHKSMMYSDHMIHAPGVPIIRDDEGALLDPPLLAAFITAPAVNAGVVVQRDKKEAREIPEVMARRTLKMLALAAHEGHDALILGAWGCGVFRNDPEIIAAAFAHALLGPPAMIRRFARVVFAIPNFSNKDNNFDAFEAAFSPAPPPAG